MADSDYTQRGTGGSFTSVATLGSGVGPLDTTLPISSLLTAPGDTRVIGEGVMLGTREICRLVSVAADHIVVARGCADTIPQAHSTGTAIWFYEDALGREDTPNEHASGTTVGVKLLTFTVGGGRMALRNSPPNEVTFNWRFNRPYPPGNMQVNGAPWFAYLHINDSFPEAVLTWAHRDRVLQADQLLEHEAGNVGPEAGTTYTVRVYDATDTMVREVTGISGTTWTYTKAMGMADLGAAPNTPAYLTICSSRGGLESLHSYRVNFFLTAITEVGYGWNFGNNWGGNP